MSDLPKCKLCGASAHRQQGQFAHIVEHELAQSTQRMCPLEMVPMTVAEWRALMAPPVVTDAMVERATSGIYTLWWDYNEAKMGRDTLARAVLEAALKE